MNLEDLNNALVAAAEQESDGLFNAGKALAEGIAGGIEPKVAYGRFAYYTRLSRRTGENRRKVWEVLGEVRNPELSWQIHAICCEACELDKPETWENARKWLEIASGKDSKGRGYTTRTLSNEMKAAGLDPNKGKAVYLVDKTDAMYRQVQKVYGEDKFVLEMVIPYEAAKALHESVHFGQTVLLTIIQPAPQALSEAA